MKRVIQAPNLALATLWAELLGQAGIGAVVQQRFNSSIAGEIPPDQSLPEVWVTDEAELERAKERLAELTNLPFRHWRCLNCGEMVEGPFQQCWNCGAAMP